MNETTVGWTIALALGLAVPASAAAPPKVAERDARVKATPLAPIASPRRVRPSRLRTVEAPPVAAPPRAAARRRSKLPNPYDEPCHGLEALGRNPGPPPFLAGEELGFELTVAGAYIGRMEMKIGRPRHVEGRTRVPLFARARTSAFVAAIKSFEGRYMSMVDPATLTSLGVRTESTYGDDARWERVRFGGDQKTVGADLLLEGHELRREYTSDHDLTDLLTLLYLARVVTVHDGMKACQDVFAARRLWRMTAEVEGTEMVDTPAGERPAWKVATVFDRKPTPGLRHTNRPRMEVDVYLAKDGSQAPLQFVVRTKEATAKGRLVRWSTKGKSPEETWSF